MSRWYRQALPPFSYIVVFALLVLLTDSFAGLIWIVWGEWLLEAGAMGIVAALLGGSLALIGMAAGCFGLQRIFKFPSANPAYLKWLAMTPWDGMRRPPFGPWCPVWGDVVPLSVLGMVSASHAALILEMPTDGGVNRWQDSVLIAPKLQLVAAALWPAAAFVMVWGVAGFLSVTAEWKRSGFAVLLAFGLLIHLSTFLTPTVLLPVLSVFVAVTFVLTCRRMACVLKSLPERTLTLPSDSPPRRIAPVFGLLSPRGLQNSAVAWLERNRPRVPEFALLLIVWLTIPQWPRESLPLILAMVLALALSRGLLFAYGTASHLGILARLHTRRLILPNYDRVWLPSVAMIVASGLCYLFVEFGIIPVRFGAALSIVLPVLIGGLSGPNYRNWSLTAPMVLLISRAQDQQRGRRASGDLR